MVEEDPAKTCMLSHVTSVLNQGPCLVGKNWSLYSGPQKPKGFDLHHLSDRSLCLLLKNVPRHQPRAGSCWAHLYVLLSLPGISAQFAHHYFQIFNFSQGWGLYDIERPPRQPSYPVLFFSIVRSLQPKLSRLVAWPWTSHRLGPSVRTGIRFGFWLYFQGLEKCPRHSKVSEIDEWMTVIKYKRWHLKMVMIMLIMVI